MSVKKLLNHIPLTLPSESRSTTTSTIKKQQQQPVKQVLSQEPQLYYMRLTSSLLPLPALASLRNDAGLEALLPYPMHWVGEGVVTALKEGAQSEADSRSLEVLLDVVSTILENNTLFIDPYVSNPPNSLQLSKLINFV